MQEIANIGVQAEFGETLPAFPIPRQAEQQRDIDMDAFARQLPDRGSQIQCQKDRAGQIVRRELIAGY
jgi:hypothetical protein